MNVKQYNRSGIFYLASFLIPWALWFLAAHYSHNPHSNQDLLVSALGLLGLLAPLFTALYLILPNEALKKDFFSRFLNFKEVRFKYIAIACLLMPISIWLAQVISLLFGYSIQQFYLRDEFSFSSGVFPVWFLLILAPLIEEMAWHSYGTDCLRNRCSLLKTSLIFAFLWGIWHLPLAFIKDYYHSNLMETGPIYSLNFFLSLFPFVIIMNWIYYSAQRNIILTVVFHITAGYFNEIFHTHPMSKVIQTVLLMAFSIYLIVNNKTFFLKPDKNEKDIYPISNP